MKRKTTNTTPAATPRPLPDAALAVISLARRLNDMGNELNDYAHDRIAPLADELDAITKGMDDDSGHDGLMIRQAVEALHTLADEMENKNLMKLREVVVGVWEVGRNIADAADEKAASA